MKRKNDYEYEEYDDYDEYEDMPVKRRKKKKNGKKRVLIVLGIIALFLVGFIGGSIFYVFGGLTTTDLPDDDKSLGISETAPKADNIQNIALYGVDDRGNTDNGRSDAIIVLSINKDDGVLKMVSILRDSKVAVEGHGETKINHAYAYGGPELAIKTLNQNFDLNVKEYVTVNFSQLVELIDAVDGVDIELTQAEVNAANDMMKYDYPGSALISGSGLVHLNGEQAVSFARIRKLDSDNARADRQKQVLSAVFTKVTTMSKADYPSFMHKFLSIVETSLDYSDLTSLSSVMLAGNLSMEQYTIPGEQEAPWGGTDTDGVWYWIYDLDAAASHMHTILYGDTATTDTTDTTDTVTQ